MGPKKNKSGQVKRKSVRTTIELKKEIIGKYENGVRVSDLAVEYFMAKSTISTIVKNKEKIKGANVAKGVTTLTKQRPQILEEVEKLLLIFINEKQLRGDSTSEAFLCKKALEIYDDLVKDTPDTSTNDFEFKASRGWFENFKNRIGLHSVVRHGEAAKADKEAPEKLTPALLPQTSIQLCHHIAIKKPLIKEEEEEIFVKEEPTYFHYEFEEDIEDIARKESQTRAKVKQENASKTVFVQKDSTSSVGRDISIELQVNFPSEPKMKMDPYLNKSSQGSDSVTPRSLSVVPVFSDLSDFQPLSLSDLDSTGDDAFSQDTHSLDHQFQEDQAGVEKLKKYLVGLHKFYTFAKFLKSDTNVEGRSISTGTALCKSCKGRVKEISFTTQTRANLKKHYYKVHKILYGALVAAVDGQSKRRRFQSRESEYPSKKRQLSVQDKFSQKEAYEAYMSWFICTMSPVHLTDHPSTRHMMAILSPEFKIPSRWKLTRDIEEAGEKARIDLINTLHSVRKVATTADSWTADNRAFLGMTVHWIDKNSLQRKSGVLACKEIKEGQTHQLLAQTINDIHQEFGLAHKVVAITTDNGANYMAAFEHYGVADEPLEPVPVEVDPDEVIGHPADLNRELHPQESEEDAIRLPPHYRCGAHSINLLATSDIATVRAWNSSGHRGNMPPWNKAATKAQCLWNIQNRSSVVASHILREVGRKLKTPCLTKWNSYYDAIKCLLEVINNDAHLEALNTIMKNLNTLPVFDMIDKQVFTEYVELLKPVATCLDRLQSEKAAYMGNLLPNLHLMKTKLVRVKNSGLQYAKPLVEHLLDQGDVGKGFAARFDHLYDNPEILMATALHPHYTQAILTTLCPEKAHSIKRRIIMELKAIIDSRAEEEPAAAVAGGDDSDDEWNQFIPELPPAVVRQAELDEVLTKSLEEWNRQRAKSSVPLSKELFPSKTSIGWSSSSTTIQPFPVLLLWRDCSALGVTS